MGSTASVYEVPEGYDPSEIGSHVDMVLDATVQSVSAKISRKAALATSKSVPHLGGSDIRDTMKHTKSMTLKSHNSLRAHALRQHSRQKNTYISSSSIMRFVAKSTSNAGSNSSLSNCKISPAASSSTNSIPVDAISENKQKGAPSLGKKFNLKLQINDEEDWIQVSDDEDELMTPRRKREPLGLNLDPGNDQSYRMTQSGTIFVNGFCEGIGKNGIVNSTQHLRLPMRERLAVLCRLGQGASSIVYKALDISEMRLVALKMVPVFERAKRRQMVRELSALFQVLRKKEKELLGQGVAMNASVMFDFNSRRTSKDYSSEPQESDDEGNGKTFHINSQQYIVDFYDAFSNVEEGGVALMMEYMDGGSLQDIADTGGCDDEGVLANIAVQGLAGLDFLHKCNQIHRDIKPANLLINMLGDVKVSDLGILRQIEPEVDFDDGENVDKTAMHRAQTFVGTTNYMAPERIDGQEYSYSSDIWSFGLALLTVALGRLPLETTGGFWQVLQAVRDKPPPRVPDTGNWSCDFKDFISQCLTKNPDERPSASVLLKHPFLSRAFAEEAEDIGTVGVEELKSIVRALYAHVDQLRNDSLRGSFGNQIHAELNRDSEKSETTPSSGSGVESGKENADGGDLISSLNMTKLLLFGEQATRDESDKVGSDQDVFASPRDSTHRLQTLAHQLHIPLPIAIQVTRKELASFSSGTFRSSAATPKAFHGNRK